MVMKVLVQDVKLNPEKGKNQSQEVKVSNQ